MGMPVIQGLGLSSAGCPGSLAGGWIGNGTARIPTGTRGTWALQAAAQPAVTLTSFKANCFFISDSFYIFQN